MWTSWVGLTVDAGAAQLGAMRTPVTAAQLLVPDQSGIGRPVAVPLHPPALCPLHVVVSIRTRPGRHKHHHKSEHQRVRTNKGERKKKEGKKGEMKSKQNDQ